MFLEEYKNKPKLNNLILLNSSGSIDLKEYKKNWVSKNITNMVYTVYNIKTDRVSDKSVYLTKSGKQYIKSDGKMFFIDDFSL